MKRPHTKICIALSCITLFTAHLPLYAQTCNTASIASTTPGTRFTSSIAGTVTDTITGLMWKSCVEGQEYNADKCTDEPSSFNWTDAVESGTASIFAGFTDWRLPNIKELASIIERQCIDPTLNLNIFPEFPRPSYPSKPSFWSSTPGIALNQQANISGGAYYVNFSNGQTGKERTGKKFYVRLVRDSEAD